MSKKKSTKKKPNQNYSAKLSDGRRVTVKNGVKTYSGTASTPTKSSGSSGSSSTIQAVGGTREQQLANANAQMANIQKMLNEPSTKLSSSQSDTILNQLKGASTELAKIPKATAPTNAGMVSAPMGETPTPTTPPFLGDTADSAATLEASGARLTQQQISEKEKADALARDEQRKKESQPFLDRMMKTFTDTNEAVQESVERQNEAFQNYLAQAESVRAEIKTYNDRYAEVENAMNEQIAASNDAMGSMNFINNQIAQIKRNAQPDLTLLAAKSANASADLSLLQGDYQMAEKHIQNAIENMTAVAKFQYDSYKDFYAINEDNFNRTEAIYKQAYEDRMAIAKQEYEKDVADKKTIGELILAYNADGAGIKMTDTVEEAYAKAGVTNTLERQYKQAQMAASGAGGGNSNQMTDNERALSGQFRNEPIVKEYNTILAKKLSVDAIIDSGVGGPGDLALVYEFMKGLDPTSVVRETEYATAAKSGNIFLGTMARFNGYLKPEGGFMPDNVKESFRSIVDSKLGVQTRLYDNLATVYSNMAIRQGLDPRNVVLGYNNVAPEARPQQSPTEVLNSIVGEDTTTGSEGWFSKVLDTLSFWK